jgi:ABC-type long-subunit fatty acid transport system fused permease/ATPase subunit
MVKALRIAQVIALVLLVTYLWVLHSINPSVVALPLFLSIRPAPLLAIVIVLTALITWSSVSVRLWRVQRQLKRVTAERDAFVAESWGEGDDAPVIPDRVAPVEVPSVRRRADDPTDYL